LEATFEDAEGTAIDLTSATVTFDMQPLKGGELKITAGACEVTDAKAGTVKYQWQAADTDTADLFRGDFKVAIGETTFSVPNEDFIQVEIKEPVGG
jgi:hypothetical protein